MKAEEFVKIVEERLEIVKRVLKHKGYEYATQKNRMHNFYRAAGLLGSTTVAALRGMWVKHVVSINDIVDDIEAGTPVKKSLVEEKLTDNIAYLLLMDGLLADHSLVIPDNEIQRHGCDNDNDKMDSRLQLSGMTKGLGDIDFHTGKVLGANVRNFEPRSKKNQKRNKKGRFC
ncbi:MAG: hypothetical protein LBL00_08780 [Endomicrobium sp.]|nr:hypothetical protein [Endomicrobium sp.]